MNSRRTFLGLAGAGAITAFLIGRPAPAVSARFPLQKSDAEWRHLLGPQRYAVLRQAATERAFTSPLNKEHRKGTFVCAGCALPLFSSTTKFDSGTGWPSFWRPLPRAVVTKTDHSFMMDRTEVLCARCGGHLGHVFDDGPTESGKRYCINSVCLNHQKK